jgi:hypothetical protein
MLAADGSELRHRPVAQPVSEPGKYQEESILVRRAKMAQEDREPANLWVFGLVIVLWCMLCGLAWLYVIRHDDTYIIDEIHHGHVENVRDYLHEHHALARLNKLDEVRSLHLSEPPLSPPPPARSTGHASGAAVVRPRTQMRPALFSGACMDAARGKQRVCNVMPHFVLSGLRGSMAPF